MLSAELEKHFAIIDANHRYETMLREKVELLRLLLQQARGEWMGLKSKWRLRELLAKYPEEV